MIVYKFGGASVKSSDAVRNVAKIISQNQSEPLIVVVSAMGKTTNALERITELFFHGEIKAANNSLEELKKFHLELAHGLFPKKSHIVYNAIERSFYNLYYYIQHPPGRNYNYEYDRIVSSGEMLSSIIVSEYLEDQKISNRWYNAKDLIITDTNYRDANVDWLKTEKSVRTKILSYFKKNSHIPNPTVVTQGFLGGTTQGFITTLGREGSDYSAAILAYTLRAKEVVIWKDVAGLLNADPKILSNTVLLKNISYQEAIELAYFGATVIHPKTLKPLLRRSIPLKVKSFFNPEQQGSIINKEYVNDNSHPSYIFKTNQMLLSIFPKDFSFIAEHNLSRIFSEFARLGIKINLMQNSALSFSVCFDHDKIKTPALLKDLEKIYNLKYNDNLDLVTIRHYEKANLEEILQNKEILLEQKSRTTLQWVVKNPADN
jgi:aspartate kinase